MILLLSLLSCTALNSSEDSSIDESGLGGSESSHMPYASRYSKMDWDCNFLTDMAGTDLEEVGVVAILIELTAQIYADATQDIVWRAAVEDAMSDPGTEMVQGEILYNGLFFLMDDDLLPGHLSAAVTYGPIDFNQCRGYVWVVE